MWFLERFHHASISLQMFDRFQCITRSIIPVPTDPIHSRLHLVIINLTVKILTNANNLFGNPLYWTIFLLCKCIPALIKVGRRGSQNIHFCPLNQIKVSSFCFSAPVRGAGCGDLLVSTDCVRRRWCWSTPLCSTAVFAVFFSSHFLGIDLKTLDEIPWKASFFYLLDYHDQWYFHWGPSLDYHYQWYM